MGAAVKSLSHRQRGEMDSSARGFGGGAGARDRHRGALAFKINRRAASAARTSRANQPAHHLARGPCLRAVRGTQAGADPNRGAGADLDAGSSPDTQN